MLTRIDAATPPPSWFHDEGYGYDTFGLELGAVRTAVRWGLPWYRRYFRVESSGSERIPAHGPAILVGNHGGVLPLDATLLWLDVALRTDRVLRLIADRFIPLLPFFSTAFARCGVVAGTHANVRHLLDRGELIAIFPEGVTGPAKPFSQRYHLQEWRVGHAEHAIRHHAPIIPVAILGIEEAWPVVTKLPIQLFGAPYLPLPATLLPLPRKIRIHYGTPIDLAGYDADEPAQLVTAAGVVRSAVADLIARGRS